MPTTTTETELCKAHDSTGEVNKTGKVLRPKWLARGVAGISLATAIAAGTMFWLDARHYETTDDAQVDGHFAALSTRIDGTVVWINPNSENDHAVKPGDLLLRRISDAGQLALPRLSDAPYTPMAIALGGTLFS